MRSEWGWGGSAAKASALGPPGEGPVAPRKAPAARGDGGAVCTPLPLNVALPLVSPSQTVFERNCRSEDCAADLRLRGQLFLSR